MTTPILPQRANEPVLTRNAEPIRKGLSIGRVVFVERSGRTAMLARGDAGDGRTAAPVSQIASRGCGWLRCSEVATEGFADQLRSGGSLGLGPLE